MQTDNLIPLIHIITSIVALISGAVVLLAAKGTEFHKRAGYVFAVVLLLVNITAAGMYNLTGTINFLHMFVLISLFSLFFGIWPALRRKSKNWLSRHVQGMTGAALGVWAAGFAELTVLVLQGLLGPKQIIGVAIGVGVVFFFLIGFLIGRFLNNLDSYSS
ncbi:MAG: DUF2306 domain-containing protein [Saprospiraceae bacterium]